MKIYAQGAPRWWRFQLVSLGNQVLPPMVRPGFYDIIVDNGMFAYVKQITRPDLDRWFESLKRFVNEIRRRLWPRQITVILPDWVWDPWFTVRAAKHPLARELCMEVKCYAVAHSAKGVMMGYMATAWELVSIDWLHGLAAPLKLNCSKMSPRAGRRIINRECQRLVAWQVCHVARSNSLECHGLGALLAPDHVKALERIGVSSIDSTAWTRPNASVVSEIVGGRWSAKSQKEKDIFFAVFLARLYRAGVDVEGLPLDPWCERACYEDIRCEDDEEAGRDRHACTKCIVDCILSSAWKELNRFDR